MEIQNEVKITDKDFEKKKFVVRNAADVQRAKLEKLMKNPEKPVIIPDGPRERDFSNAIPSFVRNVMGSSAGAGSGEFHVYRHLRRKEYARQKNIQEKSRSEQLNDDFQTKLEQNKQDAEEKTAKKRAKRQKKKAKQKANRGKKPRKEEESDRSESEEDEEEKEEEEDAEEELKKERDGKKREAEGNQEKSKQDERSDEKLQTEDLGKGEGSDVEAIQQPKKIRKEEEPDKSECEEEVDAEEELKKEGDGEKREAERNQEISKQDEGIDEKVIVQDLVKGERSNVEAIQQPTEKKEKHKSTSDEKHDGEDEKEELKKKFNIIESGTEDNGKDSQIEDQ